MIRLLGLVLLLLVGCVGEDSPRPIEGSTYRIGKPTQGEKPELFLQVFTSREECRANLGPDAVEECIPKVDRATGQVRLAFRTLDRETMQPYNLPLTKDHVQVSFNKSPITEGRRSGYELVQHDEVRVGQLFIVVLDGSGSMYENDNEQMNKVWRALNNPSVKDAFFPKDVPTGVILLRFTSRVVGLDGGPPAVLQTKRSYEEALKYLYSYDRGFTHLYDATSYATGPLMDEEAVKSWLQLNKAEPTVIVISDGFNNEKGSDLCRDNVPRLQKTLEDLEIARNQPLGLRPTVFTVGLGKAIRPGFTEVPRGPVTVRDLCGRSANDVINGGLERRGIDNVSLKWIAERGGGTSFVRNNPRGLAEVFQEAAAVRYKWYQAYFKVDKAYHRQRFETRIRLLSFANAEANLEILPSGWLDAPTGERADGRWAEPASMRATFGLVMPLIGGLVFIAFLGPAGFNARRTVTRRARGKKPKSGVPPTGPPS